MNRVRLTTGTRFWFVAHEGAPRHLDEHAHQQRRIWMIWYT